MAVLATSREPLRLRWERALPVGPLAVPDPQHLPPLPELAAVPAVALFVERARAGAPAFGLTAENASAVAGLCARLDGLPLAIELVAARAALLGPAALLERLGRRLPLPGGGDAGRAGAPPDAPRHAPVELRPAGRGEQALFRRVAAFAGGWTLEAAEAVAGPDDAPARTCRTSRTCWAGSRRSRTRASSSWTPGPAGAAGEPRFRMLETAREVALDLLEASGEGRRSAAGTPPTSSRWPSGPSRSCRGPRTPPWRARLEREEGNFRQALRWALARGDGEALELGLRLAGALGWFWFLHGYPTEAREWLTALLRPAARVPASRGRGGSSPGCRRRCGHGR